MAQRNLVGVVFIVALLPALAAADETRRTIRVVGEGKAMAPPDMARVQVGVVTEAATAADALASNNKAMEKVLATLKQHEIADKDVQTSQFTIHPVYQREPQNRSQPQVVGYRVSNLVRVQVRKLDNLGVALDALVQAGSNQVNSISFDVANPTPVLDQARREAIANAQHRAQIYATAAGVRLGKVQTVSEEPLVVSPPQPFVRGAMMGGESARVPVAQGEEEFNVRVHVVFDIEDGK